MKKSMKFPFLLSLIVLLLASCSNEKEDYYKRPSWLEPSIYKVLESKGQFTDYLKCVDRSKYASTLKSNGLYTVFAPNDSAFTNYLASKHVNSVDDLSDTLINKLVSYSIVYNKYLYGHLTDILSGGWDSLVSIKKKTTYYETIHKESYKGDSIWVYDMPSFNVGDNNYKYVPFYLAGVFQKDRTEAQAATDYNTFYSTKYTGENIQSANILEKDMIAENGVVHEIDHVLEPLPTLENLLNDPNYSMFKALINKTGSTGEKYFITYTYSKTATDYFQAAMPTKNIDAVYLKTYNDLAYNLNSERFGSGAVQAEEGGFTLFAPDNTAIENFYNDKLKDYYPGGIQTVSKDVMDYFINAQMVDDLVLPDDYKGSMNATGEFLNGLGNRGADFDASNYKKIAPASNGYFYGGDNYIKSRYFETVFTEILLNPDYSLLNTAFTTYFETTLKEELLQCELNGYTQENYTVLLPSNELLEADGFSWQWLAGSNEYGFVNSNSGSSLGNFDVATRMQRLVKSCIFKRLKNNDVNCAITNFNNQDPSAADYDGYSYAVNEYGDMVRYKDGKLQMLGNFDDNDWVTATPYKTFINGQVFKIDKLLQYSPRETYPDQPAGYTTGDLWTYILKMTQVTENPNVALFKSYMNKCLMGSGSNQLAGLSPDMVLTIFMPNNAAMVKAQQDSVLPTLAQIASDPIALKKAAAFLLYHMVVGKQFVDDGLPYIMPNKDVVTEETMPTALKDVVNNTYLAIRKDSVGHLIVSTQVKSTGRKLSAVTRTATVVRGIKHSNFFGANAVIHEINNYLEYKTPQQ